MRTLSFLLFVGLCVSGYGQRAPLTTLSPTLGTNFVIDLNKAALFLRATNDVSFVSTTNRTADNLKRTTVVVHAGLGDRLVFFPATWLVVSETTLTNALPLTLATNRIGVFTFNCYGSSETNVIVSYTFQK